MSEVNNTRLEIVQSRIKQYGIRFPVAALAKALDMNKGYISSVLAGEKPVSDNFWDTFNGKFPAKQTNGEDNNLKKAPEIAAHLPGSVTLQDHIDLLKKQAATAEKDKDRLFNNNETLARALEKLSGVYEKYLLNSDATKGQLDAIVDQVRAEHAVMMDALDRLEKNKVGTNAMQAGNLEIERKNVRSRKGKQVGAGK